MAASSSDSSGSTKPPGIAHMPSNGQWRRLTKSTSSRLSRTVSTTTSTVTAGRSRAGAVPIPAPRGSCCASGRRPPVGSAVSVVLSVPVVATACLLAGASRASHCLQYRTAGPTGRGQVWRRDVLSAHGGCGSACVEGLERLLRRRQQLFEVALQCAGVGGFEIRQRDDGEPPVGVAREQRLVAQQVADVILDRAQRVLPDRPA